MSDTRIVGTVINDNGTETAVTVEEVREFLGGVKDKALDQSFSFIEDDYGDGLVGIELHPQHGVINEDGETLLLTEGFINARLAPGCYFVFYPKSASMPITDKALEHLNSKPSNGLLLATDNGQLISDGIKAVPITLVPEDESGNPLEDPPYTALELWLIQSSETGTYVSLWDMMESILLQAATNEALTHLQKQGNVSITKEVQSGIGGLEELAITFYGTAALNDLARTNSRKQRIQSIELKQNLYGSKVQNYIQTGKTKIIFDTPNLNGIKVNAKTDRTLTVLIGAMEPETRYTRDEVIRVSLAIPKFMELYGQTSRRDLRRSLKEDLENIAAIRLSMDEGKNAFIGIPIAGGAYGIDRKGNVYFTFSPDFIRLITGETAFTEYLDPAAFKVNMNSHPNAWTIYKKLIAHSSANMGKKTEYTLSVKRLLAYLPDVPTYSQVVAGNRNFTGRIIGPIERDLNELVTLGVLTDWDYCHANGEPLTDHEQDKRLDTSGNETALPYELAIECNLTWEFTHQYYRDDLIEKKQAAQEQRIAAKEKRAAEKQKSENRIERQKEKFLAKKRAKQECTSPAQSKE